MRHPTHVNGTARDRAALLVTVAVAALLFGAAAASDPAASAPPLSASGRRPKTCVYAIALNEHAHVEPFMNASRGADLVLVADTGSTDSTPEALRAAGATVHTIAVQPFRFDSARNAALDLLPADCDLCLSLDLDERLQPGWVEALEAAWANAGGLMTAVHVTYVESWERDGVAPAVEFLQTKLHARWNYTWRGPAFELPYWTGSVGGEHQVMLPTLKVHHRPDASKGRTSSYLDLLKLGVEEDPTDAQRAFHYGRELMHAQQHEAAIKELQRYLALPGATWREERATALRHIAHCHEEIKQFDEAQAAAHRSVLEWGQSREPWLALAHASRLLDDWPTCQWAATKALGITERVPSPFGDSSAWGADPHDELALALHYTGHPQQAVEEGERALALDPGNERLQANLDYYRAEFARKLRQVPASADSRGEAELLPSPPPAIKPVSVVPCATLRGNLTTRELDLQQQRRSILDRAGRQPEGGYLAICLAVKNQHRDLPEWLDWHSRLGVSKFYIMDDSSDPPLDSVLAPYVQDGRVVHHRMTDFPAAAAALRNSTCRSYDTAARQVVAFDTCLHEYGARHRWLAFIDADEFLVINDDTPDLPTLLRDYEQYGGLAVNWLPFGSGGHMVRQHDTLTSYTACFLPNHGLCKWIKTIANTAFMTSMGEAHNSDSGCPHHAHYAPGYFAMTADGTRVQELWSPRPDHSRVSLHHYVSKSLQDFQDKMARSSGMGITHTMGYWPYLQEHSVRQCTRAADIVRQWRAADIKAAAQRLDLPTHAVQTEHASLDTGSASDQLAALLRPYQADQKQFCAELASKPDPLVGGSDATYIRSAVKATQADGSTLPGSTFTMHTLFAADWISYNIRINGAWQEEGTREILGRLKAYAQERNLAPHEVILLDIGANIGWFSLQAAAQGYTVVAFEPMAQNIGAFRRSLCENPRLQERVTLIPLGLGGKADRCKFYVYPRNTGNGITACEGQASTELLESQNYVKLMGHFELARLDDVFAGVWDALRGRVGVLMIDVQGFEHHVFAGGRKFMDAVRPHYLMADANHYLASDQPLAEVLQMYHDLGYTLHLHGFNGEVLEPQQFQSEAAEHFQPGAVQTLYCVRS